MSAPKIPKAADLDMACGFDRRGDDAFKAAANLGFKCAGHGVGRLSHGDNEDATIRVEIMKIFADPQEAALAVHIASEGAFDGGALERGGENFACNTAHVPEILIAHCRKVNR